ncbi:MAG: BlaI/MecI/CopY family transcriptional regulator [Candidatus Aenigmatarchaeota archaeon]
MVLKNKDWLDHNFLPDIALFRENEIKILAENIESGINSFVFGNAGVGKTLVSHIVLREAFEKLGIIPVYINGFFHSTFVSISKEIFQKVNPLSVLKAISKEEFAERLELLASKKNLVVCLDEVDAIESDCLYILSRLKNRFPLILITNNPEFLYKIDGRIRSSLLLDRVNFRDYTLQEIKEIIEYRLKKAFFDYEEGISLYLAGFVSKHGSDIRIALKVLQKAALIAEQKGSKTLKMEFVKNVVESGKLVLPRKEILISSLKEQEKEVLNLIVKGKKTSSEILNSLEQKTSLRTLQLYLKNLEEKGLIKSFREGNEVKYEPDL